MKHKLCRSGLGWLLLALGLGWAAAPALGQVQRPNQSISSGGGRSTVGAIRNDSVVGEISGVSSVGGSWNYAGFLGQWTDVVGLELTATPEVLLSGEQGVISSVAFFSDGSQGWLAGSDLAWSWIGSGLLDVTDGVVTADLIVANQLASVEGRYLGVAGRVDLLVVPAEHPVIVTPPLSVQTNLGSTVSFVVEVAGLAPFSYQWFREATLIHTATNAVFTLADVQEEHLGLYTVQIRNRYGLTLASANLSANGVTRPEIVSRPPVLTMVNVGSVVSFKVEAAGDPPFSYQWRLNGQDLVDRPEANIGELIEDGIARGSVFGATNDTLIVTNVQLADAGSYSVVVRDSLSGVVLVEPIGLAIAGLAELPPEIGGNRGTNIASTASINPLRVVWRPLSDGVATVTTAGSGFDTLLTVYERPSDSIRTQVATDDDAGGFRTSLTRFEVSAQKAYEVVVDGFAGATGDVLLQWAVQPTDRTLPRVVQQPSNVWTLFTTNSVVFATNVVLTVQVEGTEQSTFVWYHNGVPLDGPATPELTLTNVTHNELGQYQLAILTPGLPTVLSGAIQVEAGTQENLISGVGPKGIYDSTGAPAANSTIVVNILETLITNAPGFAPSPRGLRPASVAQGIVSGSQLTASGGEENRRYFSFTIDAKAKMIIDNDGSGVRSRVAVGTGPAYGSYRSLGLTNIASPGSPYTVEFEAQPTTVYWVLIFPEEDEAGQLRLNWKAELDPNDFKAISVKPTNSMAAVIYHAKNQIAGVAGIFRQSSAAQKADAKTSNLLTKVDFTVSADLYRTSFNLESDFDYWVVVERLPDVQPLDPLIIDSLEPPDTVPQLALAPEGSERVVLQWTGANWRLQLINGLTEPQWTDVPATNNRVEMPQQAEPQFFRLSELPQ